MSLTRPHDTDQPTTMGDGAVGRRRPPASRRAQLGRAASALVTLVGLAVGVPVALAQLMSVLPVPGLAELWGGSVLRADDGGLLVAVLLLIAWVAWAVVVVCVAVEVVAVVRRVPSPRLPGLVLPQRLAGWLVASLLVVLLPAATAAPAEGVAWDRALERVLVEVDEPSVEGREAGWEERPLPAGSQTHLSEARAGDAKPRPTVRTQRHDTLWLLAEQHLGAGERYEEILALNLGAPQSDGRALGRDGRIYPGWELQLPGDASVDASRPARVVVAPGDTLWDIAADELGDPQRYRELFAENEGDRQPDGQRLRRASLIRPGWVLTLPGSDGERGQETGSVGRSVEGSSPEAAAPDGRGAPAAVPDLDRAGAPKSAASPRAGAPGEADPGIDPGGSAEPSPAHGAVPDLDRGDEPVGGASDPSSAASDQSDLDRGGAPVGAGAGTDESVPSVPSVPDIDRSGAPSRPAEPKGEAPSGSSTREPAGSGERIPAAETSKASKSGSGGGQRAAGIAPGHLPPRGSSPEGGRSGGADLPPTDAESPQSDASAGVHSDQPEPLPNRSAGAQPDDLDGPATASLEHGSVDPASVGTSQRAGAFPLPSLDKAVGLVESSVGPASSTLTAFLLGAVAGELTRRRRQFQRHRRPGERMTPLTPDQRRLEATLRTAPADRPADLLDPALRALALSAHATGRELPSVRIVRVTGSGVDLFLAEEAEPIAPFVSAGERHWTLDHDQLAALPVSPTTAPDKPDLKLQPLDPSDDEVLVLPGLATLGAEGDARILLDLAEVGTLRLAGSADALTPVLRGLATELAYGRLRGATERLICSSTSSIAGSAGAGEVGIESDPQRTGAAVRATLDRGTGFPDAGHDPLLVVLSDQLLPVLVERRSGVALVTTEPTPAAGATLVVDSDGAATLMPEGIRLHPQVLSEADEATLVGLLSSTNLPEEAEPERDPETEQDVGEGPATLAALELADRPASTQDAPDPAATASSTGVGMASHAVDHVVPSPSRPPTILVLGELRVLDPGGPAESTRIGRLAETAAFVLLNPDVRPSELQSALWPQRRSNPQTCRQMISRTRTWLGRTDEGEPYLEPFTQTGGRLRLRPEVGSDWARFQELADAGFADPQDTENLSAALRLVRGRPFGSVAARELPWADLHLNDMLCLITDVAHELALRHEREGRYGAARDAVLRGLRTQTESELLAADLARLQQHA